MRSLTRDQIRSPRRETEPVSLPEFSAPVLVAKPSADLALRLREGKLDMRSAEAITAMVADMLVAEDGTRMFTVGEVPAFLEDISADSLTALITKCLELYTNKGGAPGNSKPSTSAA
jgi:hypothetical protein